MGSWSVGSGTPDVATASGLASGAPGCGVGAEAPPVEGAVGVGEGNHPCERRAESGEQRADFGERKFDILLINL